METKTGLFSARAFSNAASPHGSQSTGLNACCRRYGLFSEMSAFGFFPMRNSSSTNAEAVFDLPVTECTGRTKRLWKRRAALFRIKDRRNIQTPPAINHRQRGCSRKLKG